MKTMIAVVAVLSMALASGCRTSTSHSRKGGTVSQDKQFTIMIPKNQSIRQGSTTTVIVMLNRDAYFKQDVHMDIEAKGIDVKPNSKLIKASERPELELRISADRDAALGKYIVKVRGTPSTGTPAETTFTVEVVKP